MEQVITVWYMRNSGVRHGQDLVKGDPTQRNPAPSNSFKKYIQQAQQAIEISIKSE